MKPILLLALLLGYMSAVAQPPDPTYKLVWSDEFSYNGLPDSTKWGYDTGGDGWGNNDEFTMEWAVPTHNYFNQINPGG